MRRLDEPLHFAEAAREIEWEPSPRGSYRAAGRRLKTLVLRREREIGKQFAIRNDAGFAYKVTLGSLTQYLPELRPSRIDTLADVIRPLVAEMEHRTRQIVLDELDRRLGNPDQNRPKRTM